MLEAGIISHVYSSWTSPIVLATNKDGSPKFSIEFRKLNSVMKREKLAVPSVEDIFDDFRGNSIFNTLDLFRGYWRIKKDKKTSRRQLS